MAGIPPLAGFFAKFYVFLAAIQSGLFWLAVVGVVTSVISAFYYLAIISKMYFQEPARGVRADDGQAPLRSGGDGHHHPVPISSRSTFWSTAAERAARSLF